MEREAWHGPAVKEVLAGVTASTARARPIAGAHTIWELVLHITAWIRAGEIGLAGEKVDLPDAEDWPAVTSQSEEDWQAALRDMDETYQRLRSALSGTSDTKLDDTVTGRDYSVYVLLHGVVQHCLYHAGQIVFLKAASKNVSS
jgi:uncharacterized damage-inducible protein DinB